MSNFTYIPDGFSEYKLGDICDRLSSGDTITAKDISDSNEYPVFGGNGIRGYADSFNFDGECAIIGRQGAKCGNVRYFNGKAFMTEHAIVVYPNDKHNTRFLSYVLDRLDLGRLSGQSAQPGISVQNIAEQYVLMPSKEIQDSIANILGSLENKIDLNKKMVDSLESMAKTIYDYWFVQFDFPNVNGKPYKTSGGKMEWNETLSREIPAVWEVDNLFRIASYVNGLACQKYRPQGNEESLPVIKIREMHEGVRPDTERVSANIPLDNVICDGDILFSWSATLEIQYWTGGKAGLNQHIFKVIPSEDIPKEYVYHQLKEYIVNFVKIAEARKTTMGHITQDHLKFSRIVIPPYEVLRRFEERMKPIHKQMVKCNQENRKLIYLRDFLLPMLMNGQVTFRQ